MQYMQVERGNKWHAATQNPLYGPKFVRAACGRHGPIHRDYNNLRLVNDPPANLCATCAECIKTGKIVQK